jgi:hypothetical protein
MSKKFWNDNELEVKRVEVNSRFSFSSGIIIFILIAISVWVLTK